LTAKGVVSKVVLTAYATEIVVLDAAPAEETPPAPATVSGKATTDNPSISFVRNARFDTFIHSP